MPTKHVRALITNPETRKSLSLLLFGMMLIGGVFLALHARQATIIHLIAQQNTTEAIDALLNDSDFGYVLMKDTGNVVEWNPAMERLTGYDRSEMICDRNAIEKLMTPEMYQQHSQCFKNAFLSNSKPKVTHVSCELIRKDGKAIPVQITVRVVQTRHDGKYAIAHFDKAEQIKTFIAK